MYADAHVKRAAVFASLCDLQKCYEEFDKAIERKRDHADIYTQRGRVRRGVHAVSTLPLPL